jgi:hypothetical protein
MRNAILVDPNRTDRNATADTASETLITSPTDVIPVMINYNRDSLKLPRTNPTFRAAVRRTSVPN